MPKGEVFLWLDKILGRDLLIILNYVTVEQTISTNNESFGSGCRIMGKFVLEG